MKTIFKLSIISLVILVCSCGKSDSNDVDSDIPKTPIEEEQENPETPLNPTKSVAIVPENGDVCSDFSEIENSSSNVLVAFKWTTAEHTSSYKIEVFEGDEIVANEELTNTELEVPLGKGKTYTWQITSLNSTSEVVSDTFSFSTPGIPIENYVPYAAEITVIFDTTLETMSINWIGSDEDGDELSYDLSIHDEENELVNESDLLETEYGPLDIIPDMEYTIEVKSKDSSGNISVSTITRKM
ncbi:hypothetical protein [Maribacter sp. LLG6340-A2]|uniref:hypothetical protein n=1 Tax=Maribacter sp. LLG6340-A2 TaxID=3160834 RepID=UPI0038631EB1